MAGINRSTFDEIAQNFDDVRDDYSGRGMYGKRCLAIVIDGSAWDLRADLETIRDDCAEFDMPDEADDLDGILAEAPEEDTMGLSRVYYWPWIQVEEEDRA